MAGRREEVLTPSDPDWDEARLAWNLAVDQHPDAIAIPVDVGEVGEAVRIAREDDLRVCVQGTGHNAGAYGDLSGCMLIKTERMRGVEIRADERIARVEAGVTWGEVVAPAAEHGLSALAGSSHDVGVVGYSLGGGVSWFARKFGLASDRIIAAELVDADGEWSRVTSESDPDTLWALRGGGGNFGIVTALEFELLPIQEVYAGALFFPFERSLEVLEAWRRWTATVPDETTSVGRLLQFPPMPEIPEPMRGRSFAVVQAVHLGSEEQGAELLAPLRALGPEPDTFAMTAPVDLLALHGDPPGPVPGRGDHQLLSDLDEASLAAVVEAVGPGSGSPLVSFELRHLGGALGRREEGCGALGAIDGQFMTFGVGILAALEMAPPVEAAQRRAREALAPMDSGLRYGGFAEVRTEPESLFERGALERLRAVKERIDPSGLFRGNHSIEAAPTG